METDLHQVIKANDDLTPEHHQYFVYQLLRAMKYIHTANVFHRDLKPKNILANADCNLKVCDFGLARVAFSDAPQVIFWTDYVATRWYRAPELCGSFFTKYTPAIDMWGIGCIFAEILLGKPLFPGKNVVSQLELITDLLGTPTADVVNKVRNEKARRFLQTMPKKPAVPFQQKFPGVKDDALSLLARLLAFDPAARPTAAEALQDPYFKKLSKPEREPSASPISKLEFDFERRKVSADVSEASSLLGSLSSLQRICGAADAGEVRRLIYEEILEYHPQMKEQYFAGKAGPRYVYPSAVDNFKRQFMHMEGMGAPSQVRALGADDERCG
eukprot:scaffold1318_cov388-Prasinococcus_capsulatus_cf.AAC.82